MLTVRSAGERGRADHGWLQSSFTFSFAEFHDPAHMGFRALRVINEDYIAPAMGFGRHPHKDMEILTYVLEGAVKHEDSMGSSALLAPGELQHMSAGTGVRHSEINPSEDQTLHLLQMWLLPNRLGIAPRYEQKRFSVEERPDELHLLASQDGREGSFVLAADAELYAASLSPGAHVQHRFRIGYGWLQVARGSISIAGRDLAQGDGVRMEAEPEVAIASKGGGEFLLFDLG